MKETNPYLDAIKETTSEKPDVDSSMTVPIEKTMQTQNSSTKSSPVDQVDENSQEISKKETKESEYSEPAFSDKLEGYPTFFHKHEAS